ncbi:MAG TPA: hypothetical protein VD738_04475 [Nitrospira sp.]|nr:hypothetical protein [Nitrospira sp.]
MTRTIARLTGSVLLATSLTQADTANSVFSPLEVEAGRLSYSGIWLGMTLRELNSHLGYRVFPRKPQISPGKAFVVAVIDDRSVHITFTERNGQTEVDGLVLQRMAHEDPASWTQSSLVEALRTRVPLVEYALSEHPAEPSETLDRSPIYVFPGVEGQRVLLKPDEETIYIGYNEGCGQ